MPLLWTLKTSSAAPMRDKLIFIWLNVIASFDTVDRGILGCASGRLGFPSWFRRVFFSYHARVKLRFKLACLDPPAWWRKERPPGKNIAQSSVDLGAVAANVTETDEEKILTKQAVRHRVAPEAEA